MKKQRMTTEARSFGFGKIALVLVMLVALACCFTVITAAETVQLNVNVGSDLVFTGVEQTQNGPAMVYGTEWSVDLKDGASYVNALDAADRGKVGLKATAAIDSANVGTRKITVSYELVALTADADLTKYAAPANDIITVTITPKTLTWNGNASASVTYGDKEVAVSNTTIPNIGTALTLNGIVNGDTVQPTINATISVADLPCAGNYPAFATVPVSSSNPNYVIENLVVDVTAAKIKITSIAWGEYNFTWGEAVVIRVWGTDANGNTHEMKVLYDPNAAEGNVGDYYVTAACPDDTNYVLEVLNVKHPYHINVKEYVLPNNAFPNMECIGDRSNAYRPAVNAGEVPATLLDAIKYTVNGQPFNGTSAYGVYTVKAELPASANYIFKDQKGNTVTSLTATLTVKSKEYIPAGTQEKPYQIILYSQNGYVGTVNASVAIPEITGKAFKSFRYNAGYTLTVSGAEGETFVALIPINAALYNKNCDPFTAADLYVYESATDEKFEANGYKNYKVTLEDGYFRVEGISGSEGVTFVIAPAYHAPFFLTAPGIALLVLLVVALIVLMFLIGMYLRRNPRGEDNEVLVVDTEGDAPEVVPVEVEDKVDLEEATAEHLDDMAAEIAETVEPVAEDSDVDGVAEAVEESMQEMLDEASEEVVEEPAVETVAIVETDDEESEEEEEEEEESFDFGDMELDFFDAVEEAERYADLLEQESRGEVRIVTRYRRSFLSRMTQSQGNVQDYYSEIKNALLSYKGVKSRVSWNYDAFNRGRAHVAKINAKTKTLYLYLAIDPAELADTKYTFVDVSSKKKYATVPVLMKIKGERKFKHALELIDKICGENMTLAKLETEAVDYRVPYATTEELVQAGVIKKLVAGVPVVYGETPVSEEPVAAVTPATEDQEVIFIAPTDAPAVEAAAEEIVAEEVPASAETPEDDGSEA